MIRAILNIIIFTFGLFFITDSFAQHKIEGDTVVFSFDARDYKKFSKDGAVFKYKLKELDVKNVFIAGEFNGWSRDQWKMHRTGEFTFELRKKLKDFHGEFSWAYKFIVNGLYWAEPDKHSENIVVSSESTWFYKIFDHNLYAIKPDANGNAHFFLEGYEDANKVILSGTFNRWSEDAFKMIKIKGGWKLSLKLKPDTYQYKFIVDGTWMEDPNNPNKVYNEHHTFNSVLIIDKQITFKLQGFTNAKEVILSGSFNKWDTSECVMQRKDDYWFYTLKLPGGKHQYKFIVDGAWIIDPQNPIKEYDLYGNINSVKMVD